MPPMAQDGWTAVDRYIDDLLVRPDEVFGEVQKDAAAAGLPAISVSASQGKLLHLLARLIGARRILELGTLAGFSGIWMARALPSDGRLVTIEMDPAHANVAQRSFDRAGVAALVEIRLGAALQVLPQLEREGAEPFDMVFIDADKGNYAAYLDWAIRLARPGALIVADNVVRDGEVIDEGSTDPSVPGRASLHDCPRRRFACDRDGGPDRRGEGLRRSCLRHRHSPVDACRVITDPEFRYTRRSVPALVGSVVARPMSLRPRHGQSQRQGQRRRCGAFDAGYRPGRSGDRCG